MNSLVGYGYLLQYLGLRAVFTAPPCQVDARVLSLIQTARGVQVPTTMSISTSDDLLDHLVFALRYEGVYLELLQAILPQLPHTAVQDYLTEKPNSEFSRKIGFLYEYFTDRELSIHLSATAYVHLFDEKKYITGERRANKKFKVYQNGLGDLAYCPTIRRTQKLDELLRRDLFFDLSQFVERVGGVAELERTLGWAYLSETRSSFDIEGESPSQDKTKRFVQLLHQAHEAKPLNEEYLCELQSSIVLNPLIEELSFRTTQNWLQRGSGHFRLSDITYIPPAPLHNQALMQGLMDYANAEYPEDSKSSLLKALTVSFGFVFNHPFLDGNGRISRFLIHHGLCRAGLLANGLILPISVALKEHELGYLRALESVSKKIHEQWSIKHIDEDQTTLDAEYIGNADPYRFWDATEVAEFGLEMAHYALDHTLVEEQLYLERFDQADRLINQQYDLQNKHRAMLIRSVSQAGRLSNNVRKKMAQYVISDEVLDGVEQIICSVFQGGETAAVDVLSPVPTPQPKT